MDYGKFWEAYYNFWDEFVKDWFAFGSKEKTVSERAAISFGRASCINVDELPEPYLGFPDDNELKAVFLNLNPGMCQKGKYGAYRGIDLEATKFYSNIDIADESVPSGWLIKKFRDEAGCSYKEFVKKWSCLNPDLRYELHRNDRNFREVCGVEWWQGNKANAINGRMKWVRQIYGDEHLCPQKVFAPEFCPYHSAKWEFDIADDIELAKHIVSHVLVPAIVAVHQRRGEVPFAIAVGKAFYDILEKIKGNAIDGVSAVLRNKWACEGSAREFNDDDLKEIWPKDNGKFIVRSYYLYKVKISDVTVNGISIKDVSALILVTYTPSGNKPPKADFNVIDGDDGVEKKIREYVQTICAIDQEKEQGHE